MAARCAVNWPSQAAQSEALGERLRRARVERWLRSVFSSRVRAGKGE